MVDRIDPHPGELLMDPACGTGGFLTSALRHMRERYVKPNTILVNLQNPKYFKKGKEGKYSLA
jgi:type I restriction-modification system DNA methylase subunit